MALFDFLKKQKKQEKEKAHSKKSEVPVTEAKAIEEKTSQIHTEAITDDFVILHPHVTERARDISSVGQYTFVVERDATKLQVRSSVERIYNVHVRAVRMIQIHGKPRRRGLTKGTKKGYKKAVVALRKGEAIDIF